MSSDIQAQFKYLSAIHDAWRCDFERAQQRFPSALIASGRGGVMGGVNALLQLRGIGKDMLKGIRNLRSADVCALSDDIAQNSNVFRDDQAYMFERMRQRILLSNAPPYALFELREKLRFTGATSAHKFSDQEYSAFLEKVFSNARDIARYQADLLGFEHIYDAPLCDFTPGITAQHYRALLEALRCGVQEIRSRRLSAQSQLKSPLEFPSFSLEQAQALSRMIGALLPLPRAGYEHYVLEGLSSLCMGQTATIKYTSNPFKLAETVFHERIAHLTYRYNAEDFGGIGGFHLDEARALSMERFFLKDAGVLAQICEMMRNCYERAHPAFELDNVLTHAFYVAPDLCERAGADDLSYILQETVRGQVELDVMSGILAVRDIPDYMAHLTQEVLGLDKAPDGMALFKDTFQWPLCMQGHIASYPQGIVLGAQLHEAAQKTLGQDDLHIIDQKSASPYFGFMRRNVDLFGAQCRPQKLIERVCTQPYMALSPLMGFLTRSRP